MGRTRNRIITTRGRAIIRSLLRRGQDNHEESTIFKAKDIAEQNTDRAGHLITIFLPAVESMPPTLVISTLVQSAASLVVSSAINMGNSCSVIDMSWSSPILWIALIGLGIAAALYYRHRVRKSSHRSLYKTSGGEMDLYNEFIDWKHQRESTIERQRQEPVHRQRRRRRRNHRQEDQEFQAVPTSDEDEDPDREELLLQLRQLQACIQKKKKLHSPTKSTPSKSSLHSQSIPLSQLRSPKDIASSVARHSQWEDI